LKRLNPGLSGIAPSSGATNRVEIFLNLVPMFGIKVTYSVRLREQAFDSGLGQIPHPISESLS
jgi:hypothetical protein